jgi:hypothetical protein
MRSAKQRFDEGLDVRCPEFNYWPNVVGEQIGRRSAGADANRTSFCHSCVSGITERRVRKVEVPSLASVAFELSFDPNHAVKEIGESSATTIQ